MKLLKLLIFSYLLIIVGCGRKDASNTSFSIDLSNLHNQKLSSTSVAYKVYVQVHSPDFAAVSFFDFDCSQNSCDIVEVEVPGSTNSQIQVVVATQSSQELDGIFYGEVSEDLSSGEEKQVNISLNAISDYNQKVHWSGRVTRSDGSNPSGPLVAFLSMNGSPEMALPILNTQVLAGWYDLEFGNGLAMNYRLQDGEALFTLEDGVSTPISREILLSRSLAAATDPTMQELHLSIPQYFAKDILTNTITPQPGLDLFLSHLGPTNITHFCVDAQGSETLLNSKNEWCSDPLCTTHLQDHPDNTGDILSSQPANALALCTLNNNENQSPIFRHQYKMTRDQLLGFQFPLKAHWNGNDFKFINVSETSLQNFSISGHFLNGIHNFIAEVHAYGILTSSALPKSELCHHTESGDITSLGILNINAQLENFSGSLNYDPSNFGARFLCIKTIFDNQFVKAPLFFEEQPKAVLAWNQSSPHDLGTLANGSSNNVVLTITNTGSFQATGLTESGLSTFTFDGGSYPGSGGDCRSSLLPGSSCTINIHFAPGAHLRIAASSQLKNRFAFRGNMKGGRQICKMI